MPWMYDPKYDPLDWAAFVYRITLPDGRYYIGKRNIYLSKGGKIFRKNQWRDYWGSSKELRAEVDKVGKANCTREILKFCVSSGEASYRELELLVKTDALLDPLCMNKNILMRYSSRVLRGYKSKARRVKYLKDIADQKAAAGIK